MKTGLVIGKFAPLHKGHEFLLRSAADAVDTLVVLVYDAPDVTRVPLSVRAGWVRTLYPNATVIEGQNPPTRGVWNEEMMRAHENFIKNLVLSYRITHVFSGEDYGERLSRALGAEHVRVEKVAEGAPISATMIRRHPDAEQFVSENIYHDMREYKDVL